MKSTPGLIKQLKFLGISHAATAKLKYEKTLREFGRDDSGRGGAGGEVKHPFCGRACLGA